MCVLRLTYSAKHTSRHHGHFSLNANCMPAQGEIVGVEHARILAQLQRPAHHSASAGRIEESFRGVARIGTGVNASAP